jgi:predicted AlkP superfamily phosphohydrolase/phosphomutase/Tfp pilus assembly protein PilF
VFRSKFARALGLLAGMTGVIYILVSLYLPSSRRLIFGVDKRSGQVRLVQNRVAFLPPHQYYRLSFEKRDGLAQRDGLVRILSKERVPVTVTYRLRFTVPAEERLPDARGLVQEGFNGWMRTRVAEAVSAVTQEVPIEELLSPTSQFSTRRDVLRDVVARHLGGSGLQVKAFEIARIEPDREALLESKRQELRRGARGVAGRVAIFALDGADWELISELADDGRVPNLKALAQGGTTASLQTIQPTVSPLLWTTLSTGLPPDRHGVIDFVDRSSQRPVDAYSRRTPALWEIAQAFGRSAVVVNWWGAWPATSGVTTYDAPVTMISDAISPPSLEPRVRSLAVPAESIGHAQVGRFLNISAAEYDTAVRSGNAADPVNVMRNVLAKTWTDHRVGMSLYQQQEPLLTMVSFEGTDAVNHLFAPYHPPYREGMSQTEFRKYWPTVANYYSEVDRLLGEWMKVLSEDTTVIVVSSHGFRWGKNRPRTQPIGRSALPDHRNPGIFIAYGNHVAPSRASHSISLYDLTPTVLSILGLPKSTEMPGTHAPWVFRDLQPVTSVRVVSYEEFFVGRPRGGARGIDPERYKQQLQATGHLFDASRMQPVFDDEDGPTQTASTPLAPAQWGSYAWYNNQGIELRKQNKHREAVEAFQKAIDINPTRPTPYLNMAMTLFERQQYTAADEVFIMAVARNLPNAEQWFVDFAALYRSRDMTSRAIALLYKGKQIYPQSYLIAANLGSALAQADRYSEGLPELERALGLQPSSTLALNNIGTYYAKKQDFARALDFWNRSLTIDGRQPAIRAAAEAARTHL